MDGDTFDALVQRALGNSSRRGIARLGIGALAASALASLGLRAANDAQAKKKGKGKKKKTTTPTTPVSSPNPGGCPPGTRLCPVVGCLTPDQCCANSDCPVGMTCRFSDRRCIASSGCDLCTGALPLCCDDATQASGKKCFAADQQCCPAAYGGGSCNSDNEACCPPFKGDAFGDCAWLDDGEHCCPPDSGGWCLANEKCCPSATTNEDNFGCCPTGVACCNLTSDCDEGAGEECMGGCCV